MSSNSRELPHEAKVICISNQKGGVAKTTTAVNVSAGLAMRGHRTLIIDLDPQGNATMGLGLYGKSDLTISDILLRKKDIRDVILNTGIEGLDLVPANIKLDQAELMLSQELYKEERLKKSLEGLDYDYIIIDCRPSLGVLTINALYASNHILVPIEISRYALEGFGDLLTAIMQVKRTKREDISSFTRIFLAMVNLRATQSIGWVMDGIGEFEPLLLKTQIRRNESVNQAHMASVPVTMYDPKSNGALDYNALVEEVIPIWQR